MISPLTLISLKNIPIFKQLQLEEALLRGHEENYCLINSGSKEKAIVMGISSPIDDHLDKEHLQKENLPIIKRFSGGGTVFVDENTLFVTFIFNESAMPIQAFPEPILKWSESFYRDVFKSSSFALKENDFVFGDQKFGGNAKYIRKNRWLLHTSFLWDYDVKKMQALKLPSKRPSYRKERDHAQFLTPLKAHFESKERLIHQIESQLLKHFKVKKVIQQYPKESLQTPHRKTTTFLTL